MLTFDTWQQQPARDFDVDDTYKGALHTLEWAYETYGDEVVYACSFGIEGIVLIDLIAKVKPDAKIVFLDTNKHFQETYDVIEKVQARYPQLRIELKQPKLTLEQQAEQYGDKLWETNPNQCCKVRKIEPLDESLSEAIAWISGLRREQGPTRANTNFINLDTRFESIKICPLIHWTWKDVWRYVSRNELDYNILHDRGYPSIGCAPCTNPAFTEEDLRAGRWSGQGKTECGLHG